MLIALVLGATVMAVNVFVQTLTVLVVVHFLHRETRRYPIGRSLSVDGGLLSGVVLLMFCGHLVQMAIWAFVFVQLGEFQSFAMALYHSMVNFSTLGYGDIVMSERWSLLGPFEAGTGVLMFGVSTAAVFAVLMRMMRAREQLEESKGRRESKADV